MAIYDYSDGGFPASPATDDTLAMNGTTYKYNGSAWEVQTGGTTSYVYTATSGQTAFTGSDSNSKTLAYTAASLHVFLNGVLLDAADYTATDGTTVTLGTGASTGDTLQIVAYGVLVSAGGGGGAWEVISSQTVTSAVSSVDFTGMSGYDEYRLVLNGVYISSNGGYLKFWPRQGGSFQTGGASAQRMTYNARSGSASETFWGTTSFMITSSMSSDSGSTTHGELRIPSPHTTKNHLWSLEGIAAYGGFNFYRTTAHFNSGAVSDYKRPIDGVQIIPNSGTIDGGTFTLYGIKNS